VKDTTVGRGGGGDEEDEEEEMRRKGWKMKGQRWGKEEEEHSVSHVPLDQW